MNAPTEWNSHAAAARCRIIPFHGTVWRAHKLRYQPLDDTGSRIVTGRYHRAADRFPPQDCWPALYLALAPEVALAEIIRHTTPESFPALNAYRISEIAVELSDVLDCRNAEDLGMPLEMLWDDHNVAVPQQLARAALDRGAEGILVSSATRLGDNLVVFTEQRRLDSQLRVLRSRDPHLYVPR